jgi:Flp pilus assembly protein TadD
MGLALAGQARMDDAIEEFQKTLRLDPNYLEAYNNLAVAYFIKQDFREAWRYTHLFEQHGGAPRAGFIRRLSSAMPDPGK